MKEKKQQGLVSLTTSIDDIKTLKTVALFSRFTAIWNQKWLKALEEKSVYYAAMEEWSEAIGGLSDAQLISAIDKCKRLCAFPPSVAEFLEAALDIPSFFECKEGKYSEHWFIKFLYKNTDPFYLRQMSQKDEDAYITERYNFLREKVLLDKRRCE